MFNYDKFIKDCIIQKFDRVSCGKCGRVRKINYGQCLQFGFPECCGYMMTLLPDTPEGGRL